MVDPAADFIDVEVVYALAERQGMMKVRMPAGSTLQRAIELSGLLQRYPEIDLANGCFGIYSRISKLDSVLRDRDRVEIYRPLIVDPKQARRQRAAAGKAGKKDEASAAEPPPA